MRIRFKPWARPELEASDFYRDNPEELKDKWIKEFKNQNNPINLELGCGKGQFIAQLAVQNPDINYIAENLILTRFDIERITMILGKQDNIKRIYINFCNPWPKGKHRKKRLTHTRQLEKYKTFLAEDGEIYFKTDDDDLFNGSLGYFEESGFKILDKTYDLHAEPIWDNNIETEHEKMFSEQGIKIKALIAKKL